jgi:hypothetical protein
MKAMPQMQVSASTALASMLEKLVTRNFDQSFEELASQKAYVNPGVLDVKGVAIRLTVIDQEIREFVRDFTDAPFKIQNFSEVGSQMDVAVNLYLLGIQLAIFRSCPGAQCPVVSIDHETIPILEYEFSGIRRSTSDATARVQQVTTTVIQGEKGKIFKQMKAAVAEVPTLVGRALSRFLVTRSSSPPVVGGGPPPNVEVQNKQNGWQVVYSPAYLQRQLGLGGPSSPVKGYVAPGIYRFGIVKSGPAQWHPTQWPIPSANPIFLPLP